MLIESKNFPHFLDDEHTYFEDANAPAFQSRNAMIGFGIDALKTMQWKHRKHAERQIMTSSV